MDNYTELEVWKQVVGYEGLYDVSNIGQVRRVKVLSGPRHKLTQEDIAQMRILREEGRTYESIGNQFGVTKTGARLALRPVNKFSFRTPNRILKNQKNNNGYMTVNLCRPGSQKMVTVHKLVAMAFLGHYSKPFEVNHKNGDRSDPRLENLEIVTRSENCLHGIHVLGGKRVAPKGSKSNLAKLTEEQVLDIRDLSSIGYKDKELGIRFGVSKHCIFRIRKRLNWAHI